MLDYLYVMCDRLFAHIFINMLQRAKFIAMLLRWLVLKSIRIDSIKR